MDRTTIMLPHDLKTRATNQARNMGISLGQFIREALENSLRTDSNGEAFDDSLFLDRTVFTGRVPKDLASNHDEYLYGAES
ncbi:MAG: hypothetical protein ACP5SH_05100 [Syntrophobacteraceae bacterium]